MFLPLLLVKAEELLSARLGADSRPPRGRGGTPTQPLAAAEVGVPDTAWLRVMMILFIIDGITV